MTHEKKQIHNAVHAELREFEKFKALVKRMREAQKQWKDGDPFDGTEMELAKRMCEAEREVDEYLKNMKSIDQRKSLEAENTEFDYGHDVKHYREH